jgi:hypothetical protein
METYLIKRKIQIDGIDDYSYIPAFKEDKDLFVRLPYHRPIVFKCRQTREPKKLRHLWATVAFLIHNSEQLLNELGEKSNNIKFVYEWIKIKVGYVDQIIDGDKIYLIPKHSNFSDQPNQTKWENEHFYPAMKFIADYMGYTDIYELTQASIGTRDLT